MHINSIDILELIGKMRENNVHVSAINLFRDKEYTVFDNSIRRFPSFITFMKSILGFGNESILNKKEIEKPVDVDWASGSFLAFLSSHYHMLDGFDERYFMYCEDIDICFRSKLLGRQVRYFPCIRAIHYAKHANRDFFSKHFLWHLSGAFRFLFLKKRIEK
ncbi:Rhamnosyltransferase WbbL [compost metagenome]